jgi:hypothetical protein
MCYEITHQSINDINDSISFHMVTLCFRLVLTELSPDLYFYSQEDLCHGC